MLPARERSLSGARGAAAMGFVLLLPVLLLLLPPLSFARAAPGGCLGSDPSAYPPAPRAGPLCLTSSFLGQSPGPAMDGTLN